MTIFNKYEHIIWDWNGTLLNDGWLFVDIMNSILVKEKMQCINIDKYRNIFTFPVEKYYMKLGFDLKKKSFKKHGLEFIKEYEKRRYEAKLYPKAIKLLQQLNLMGINHSILSAQHQTLLNDLINYYKIKKYFISIIGLDNYYASSKIEIGKKWINKLKIKPNKVLMIGDTVHDYEVAQSMGTDCFLISQGHHSLQRLNKTGAKIFNSLDDLLIIN